MRGRGIMTKTYAVNEQHENIFCIASYNLIEILIKDGKTHDQIAEILDNLISNQEMEVRRDLQK